jgi:DNA-binding FadR family transcriptional regulator
VTEISQLPDGEDRPLPTIHRGQKVSEAVARALVREVAEHGLRHGTRLPSELMMLKSFGIGRSSLREALRILEVHGVLTIKAGPRGGPMVEEVDSRDVARMASLFFYLGGATYRDLLEARRIMDPVMARLAAARRDEDGLRRLHDALTLTHDRDVPDSVWLRNSSLFHLVVAGISRNVVLDLLGQGLMEIWMRRLATVVYPVSQRERTSGVHEAIAEAIVGRDGDRAYTLMLTHMDDFAREAVLKYPGLLDEPVEWLSRGPAEENIKT